MVWACFTGERLGLLIVCDEGGIRADKYKDILYDELFFPIDDLLEPLEDPGIIQLTDENTFFMQDNAPYHKPMEILEFLIEHNILSIEWWLQLLDLNPIENL